MTKKTTWWLIGGAAAFVAFLWFMSPASAASPAEIDTSGDSCAVYDELDTWVAKFPSDKLKIEAVETFEGTRGQALIAFLEANTGAPRGATSIRAYGFDNGSVLIALFKDGCLMDNATAAIPARAFAAMLRAAGLAEAEKASP
jgi:hypothetical protein